MSRGQLNKVVLEFRGEYCLGHIQRPIRYNRKTNKRRSGVLDNDIDIIVAMQNLINQDPNRSIRSLKAKTKEYMKVLKDPVITWMDGIADGHYHRWAPYSLKR